MLRRILVSLYAAALCSTTSHFNRTDLHVQGEQATGMTLSLAPTKGIQASTIHKDRTRTRPMRSPRDKSTRDSFHLEFAKIANHDPHGRVERDQSNTPVGRSGVFSLLQVGDPGSPCDMVFQSCSLRQVGTVAEGALQWARDAQGEPMAKSNGVFFFLVYCMKIMNHRNQRKEKRSIGIF